MPDQIPDSVSAKQLLSLLGGAPSDEENSELPPLGDRVPALPLAAEGAGILDLSIFMEQIIAKSGGAPLIQVLQCLVYLVAAATDRLHSTVSDIEASDDPYAAEAAEVMRANAMSMACAAQLISQVVSSATVGSVIFRCQEEGLSLGGGKIPRRIFVSDALLEALGLDSEIFTAYLKRRAPISD
jgi:hypothetical protein